MKKYIIIATLLSLFLVQGCYKDDSNTEITEINPIMIDNGAQPTNFYIYQLDTLHIVPMVYKNGLPDDGLTYEWVVSARHGFVTTVIGRQMTLHAEITMPPIQGGYDLYLVVKDKELGLQNSQKYTFNVINPYDKGLLVADTRDNGLTTDISLIIANNFTPWMSTEKITITENLYSKINKAPIPGKVLSMSSVYDFKDRTLSFCTENSILRVDPYEYKYTSNDKSFIYVDREDRKFRYIYYDMVDGVEFLNVGGALIYRKLDRTLDYGYYILPPDCKSIDECDVSCMVTMMTYRRGSYCYDEKKNRFFMVSMKNNTGITLMPTGHESAVFDPRNVGAWDALGMFMGRYKGQPVTLAVMKSETTGSKSLFILDNAAVAPLAKIDLSACPNIDKAKYFEANIQEDNLYYATDDAIYTVLLNNETLTPFERYTAPAGEKITSMMVFQNGYGYTVGLRNEKGDVEQVNADSRMVVITTHNEATGEGKVITIPIERIGAGEMTKDRTLHTEYKGFGKILNVTFQTI